MNGKFFIGLVLGIMITGGIAILLNKSPSPFVDKGINDSTTHNYTTNSSNPIILAPGTKMQQLASGVTVQNSKPNASATSYDFYDVLQGKKDIAPTSNTIRTNQNVANPPTQASTPIRQEIASSPTPIVVQQILNYQAQQYIIHAGAFSNLDSANNIKAQIALLGYSAKINSAKEAGNNINRITIGPFENQNTAETVLKNLKQQGISANIVKLNP